MVGEVPPDEVLKTLTDDDKLEVVDLIQSGQVITKKKPPSLNSMS